MQICDGKQSGGFFVLTSNIPYTYTSSPSQSIIIMWYCLHLQWIICLSCYPTSSNHLKQRVDAANNTFPKSTTVCNADFTATPPQLLRAHDPRLSAGAASIGASGSLEGKTAATGKFTIFLTCRILNGNNNGNQTYSTNCTKNKPRWLQCQFNFWISTSAYTSIDWRRQRFCQVCAASCETKHQMAKKLLRNPSQVKVVSIHSVKCIHIQCWILILILYFSLKLFLYGFGW